jgi:hypothetical protein
VQLVTGAGRLIEDTLLPIRVPFAASKPRLRRREVRATAEAVIAVMQPDVIRHAREYARIRQHQISMECAEWLARAAERERSIARQASVRTSPLVQLGLFDSRAIRQHLDGRRLAHALIDETNTRTNLLEADSRVWLAHDPDIALLLITNGPGHSTDCFGAAVRC